MNFLSVSQKLALGLVGLASLYGVETIPVFAGDCDDLKEESLESCKDKLVIAKGTRLGMFDVPEYFMAADPTFSGGEGLQDYMAIGDTQIILHTNEEVQCPENIEVKGTLNQLELKGEKAGVIKVTEFKCVDEEV